MSERVEQELELLRAVYPDLEYGPSDHWIRVPAYPLPAGIYNGDAETTVEIACRIPQLLGEQPYGFWVRPGLRLASGVAIQNYTHPVSTPFGEGWGQFSWAPEVWNPLPEIHSGTTMLDFVRSFFRRLEEGA
jgi:hypothetical protein